MSSSDGRPPHVGEPIYDSIGTLYAAHRRPDPRIASMILAALGDARAIVDVGAGTGSYEPADRAVVAVEPSAVMVGQRKRPGPVVRAVAEALPFRDRSFDLAMTVFSLHHWSDPLAGLREMRRVAPRHVVLTYDPEIHNEFWPFVEYFPAVRAILDSQRTPPPAVVAEELGARRVEAVPIPHDCVDGFGWAYWRRPEAFLDAGVRACISALAMLDDADVDPGLRALERDIRTGAWAQRHADLLAFDAIDGGLRLVVS